MGYNIIAHRYTSKTNTKHAGRHRRETRGEHEGEGKEKGANKLLTNATNEGESSGDVRL